MHHHSKKPPIKKKQKTVTSTSNKFNKIPKPQPYARAKRAIAFLGTLTNKPISASAEHFSVKTKSN